VLGHWTVRHVSAFAVRHNQVFSDIAAPSTLGTFLRSFSFGHARQLDKVSEELLEREWSSGTGPGDEPLTIDVDSTICETYGLQKQGGSRFTYNYVRGITG
jgi:hypothetical protein